METIQLGSSRQQITRLGMGGCPLGGYGWGVCSDDAARNAVRTALQRGVTFFDTADIYGLGHSEELLGEVLGAEKNRVCLASKFGVRRSPEGKTWYDISPNYVREALENSLRRLKTDFISLYYIHWPDGKTRIEDSVAELDKMRQEGKIGAIGVSNFSAEEIRRACDVAKIDAVQVQFSLLDQEKARRLFDVVQKNNLTLVTWGSLAQGLLTGKYDENSTFVEGDRRNRYENFTGEKFKKNLKVVREIKTIAAGLNKTASETAIRWLLDTKPVGAVLFGAKNPAQVNDNLGSDGWALPPEGYQALSRLTRELGYYE